MRNNNISPLPFYSEKDWQLNKKWYVYQKTYKLLTPQRNLLPFQVPRRKRTSTNLSVRLVDCNTGVETDITTAMYDSGLHIISGSANDLYDTIVSPSRTIMPITIGRGYWYVILSDGFDVWYSEVFYVTEDIDKHIKIEYWSEQNQQYDGGKFEIHYETGYRNFLYIASTIALPEYEYEEEGAERDGYPYIEKQIAKKIYRFTAPLPEYVLDALRVVWMSDYKYITYDNRTLDAMTFLPTPEWLEQGAYANTTCEITTDNIMKNIAKGYTDLTRDIIIYGSVRDVVTNQGLYDTDVLIKAGDQIWIFGLPATVVTSANGNYIYRLRVTQTQYQSLLNAQNEQTTTGVIGAYVSNNTSLRGSFFTYMVEFYAPTDLSVVPLDTASSPMYVLCRGVNNLTIGLIRYSDNSVVVRMSYGSNVVYSQPIIAGQHMKIAVSRDMSNQNFVNWFIDGTKYYTQIISGTVGTTGILAFGTLSGSVIDGIWRFTGILRQLGVWDHALTEDQIIAIQRDGVYPTDAPIGLYPPTNIDANTWSSTITPNIPLTALSGIPNTVIREGFLSAEINESDYFPAKETAILPTYAEAVEFGIEINLFPLKKSEIIVNPTSIHSPAEGGSYIIALSVSGLPIGDITGNDWITAYLIDENRIEVIVDQNMTWYDRNAVIKIQIGSATIEVPVLQDSPAQTMTVYPHQLSFLGNGSVEASYNNDFNDDFTINLRKDNILGAYLENGYFIQGSSDLRTATNKTISIYFRFYEQSQGNMVLLSQGGGGDTNFFAQITNSRLYVAVGGALDLVDIAALNEGAEYLLTIVRDQDNERTRVFLNATKMYDAVNTDWLPTMTNMYIGYDPGSTTVNFAGIVRSVRFFNFALDDAQAIALYGNGTPNSYKIPDVWRNIADGAIGCVGEWLNDNAGSERWTDTSGRRNDLAAMNNVLIQYVGGVENNIIDVESSIEWSMISISPFLSISPTRGTAGSTRITVTAQANTTGIKRIGSIVLQTVAGGGYANIAIIQEPDI